MTRIKKYIAHASIFGRFSIRIIQGESMRCIIIYVVAISLSGQAFGGTISGPKRCTLKGVYTVKYNGKTKKTIMVQSIDYTFNEDGTYSSLNYAAPDRIGQGTWSQSGLRFSINADIEGMKESVLKECSNTPEGLSYGCSVTKMNAVVSGVTNPSATKMNGTFMLDQEIIYNNSSMVIGGIAKLKLSCIPT
jgi:hypothetical protein